MKPVLSLFTGLGLLDRGFEAAGFCVVSAGDALWGRDVRDFVPARHIFQGVIGGPPCQDFSKARRAPPLRNFEGAGMKCSECPLSVWRYFANGFLRWPKTCGPACARKRIQRRKTGQ